MRVRGIEIESKITGDPSGSPLLWGHALMGSMSQEEEAGLLPWTGLGERTCLVRWDARGHGASEATLNDEDYRWSELARDAWAIADELDLSEVVLGGISMGAGTALLAATIAPERTRGLVLMAPPTAWDTRPRQARIYRSSASLVDLVGLGPFRFFGALGSCVVSNRGVARVQRSVMNGLARADPRAVMAALRGAALSDLPAPERLEALDVPALILAWRGDPSHPLSTAEELASRLPNARLEVAGDLARIDAWRETLKAFVEGLP
jgi:3-oxoadipate enol-lactonase